MQLYRITQYYPSVKMEYVKLISKTGLGEYNVELRPGIIETWSKAKIYSWAGGAPIFGKDELERHINSWPINRVYRKFRNAA